MVVMAMIDEVNVLEKILNHLRLPASIHRGASPTIERPPDFRGLLSRPVHSGFVARRLHIPDMRPSGALPAGRLVPQLDKFILTRVLRARSVNGP
jgi:hypothetical protein